MKYKAIVHENQTQQVSGVSKKGREYSYIRQKVWVHLDNQPYPVPFNNDIWPDRETGEQPSPLAPGEYTIEPYVYGVSNYGELRYGFNAVPTK